MRPLQAHCHLGLGTLYATIGQQEQARTDLSTAIGLYHAMDMTFLSCDASSLALQDNVRQPGHGLVQWERGYNLHNLVHDCAQHHTQHNRLD